MAAMGIGASRVNDVLSRVAAAFGYLTVLRIAYFVSIEERFAYNGYGSSGVAVSVEAVAWTMAIAGAAALPISVERVSQFFSASLWVLVVAPSSVVGLHLVDRDQDQVFLTFLLGLATAIALLPRMARHISLIEIPMPYHLRSERDTRALLLGVSMGILLLVVGTAGFGTSSLAVTDVADVRLGARARLGNANVLLRYLFGWLVSILTPALMAAATSAKKRLMLTAAIGLQILAFLVAAQRILLFSVILVPVVTLAWMRSPRMKSHTVISSAVALVASCLISNWVFATTVFTDGLVRRLLVTPVLVQGQYLDFFADHPKGLYAYTFGSPLSNYPYELPPARLIGEIYHGSSAANANANLFADGFANLGWIGLPVVAVLLALLLGVAERGARNVEMSIVAGTMVIPAMQLANGSLFTALLTQGFAVGLYLLVVWPSNSSEPESDQRGWRQVVESHELDRIVPR